MKNFINSIIWGIVAAGGALVFQLVIISIFWLAFQDGAFKENSIYFLLFLAVTEESFKYLIIYKKIIEESRNQWLMINVWLGGVGFSLVELFAIYQKNLHQEINFASLDLVKISLLHILTFGFLGYHIGTAKTKEINLRILIFACFAHFAYNFSEIYLENFAQPITWSIIIFLSALNFFYFFSADKKLASDK